MDRNINSWAPWRLFDGSIALSISMLLAALLKIWEDAVNWPVLGLLHQMTQMEGRRHHRSDDPAVPHRADPLRVPPGRG